MSVAIHEKRAIVARLINESTGDLVGFIPILYFPATVHRVAQWGVRIVKVGTDTFGRSRDWPAWAYLATPEEALTQGDALALWPTEQAAAEYAWDKWGATFDAPIRSWSVRGHAGPEVLL